MQAERHVQQLLPEHPADGEDCRALDDDEQCLDGGPVQSEERLSEDQMSRAGDGQEFGDAFNKAENDRVDDGHAGSVASFYEGVTRNSSMAARRRRRSSWPICSPVRPRRSSSPNVMAAARVRAAAKKARCGYSRASWPW